jgi:redox-sensitive bicupin YhaK (pirin superfamily)
MQPGGKLSQPLPQGWNAFAYVLEGEFIIDDKKIEQYYNVVFEQKGDGIEAVVPDNAETPARFGK